MLSCEKEEIEPKIASDQAAETTPPEVSYLGGRDARAEIKHLKTVYRESGGHNKGVVLNSAFFRWGYIDKHRVMKLTVRDDSTQTRTVNTTYRVRRYDDNAPGNSFINLVLSENEYRTTLTLYGYVMSREFANKYHHQGYPLTDFEGVALTLKLDLGDDIKNCPNDVVAIKNWKKKNSHPENTTLPPEYEQPPQGDPNNFPGMLDDIGQPPSGGGPTGGGGSIPPLDMSWVADGVHWAGDVASDIGHGVADAASWFVGKIGDIFGDNDCACPGIVPNGESGMSLDLGGNGGGLVLIEETHYNWDHPENPYADPSFLTGDFCHNLAVGVLSELFSTDFIAESLTVDNDHKISVDDVNYMYNHPEFLIPGIKFLEIEDFSEESRLYFYDGYQLLRSNQIHGITIHYQGWFANYYTNFDENSSEYDWLVNDATKEQLDAITDFFLEEGDSEENVDIIRSLISFLRDESQPTIDVENYLNLLTNLKADSNYLLKHFSLDPGDGDYDDWKDLAQYAEHLPQAVIDKIQTLNSSNNPDYNWSIQDITDATGANVNMDLFPVKMTQLPNKPAEYFPNANGAQFTPEEFLNFVRTHINLFTKDKNGNELSHFEGINNSEKILWNSNSPLTSVIHIDIPLFGPFTNDGSVICSKYNDTEWYFTTLTVPFFGDYDGTHPVSGNRAFGLKQNSDGSYSIFTRGVTRVRYRSLEWLADWTMEQGAFGPADNLWSAFQERLVEFIDDNSFPGNASKIIKEPKRVDVDEVHDFIFGNN